MFFFLLVEGPPDELLHHTPDRGPARGQEGLLRARGHLHLGQLHHVVLVRGRVLRERRLRLRELVLAAADRRSLLRRVRVRGD